MAKSEAFERNTARVLEVMDQIPRGRCTTYGSLGAAVGIVPRYVALIMASAPEVATGPWHRVVGADATVKGGPQRTEQVRRLVAEGFQMAGDRIVDFAERRFHPAPLPLDS